MAYVKLGNKEDPCFVYQDGKVQKVKPLDLGIRLSAVLGICHVSNYAINYIIEHYPKVSLVMGALSCVYVYSCIQIFPKKTPEVDPKKKE